MGVWGWLIAVIAAAGWSWTAWRLASERREKERLTEELQQAKRASLSLSEAREEAQAVMARREKQAAASIQSANVAFAKALLPVNDALGRAIEAGGSLESYREGVRLVHKLMEQTLCAAGFSPIRPVSGDRFDPAQHESIARKDNNGGGGGGWQVSEVESDGWMYQGRLLRAARVVVIAVDVAVDADEATPHGAEDVSPKSAHAEADDEASAGAEEGGASLALVKVEREAQATQPAGRGEKGKGKRKSRKRKRRQKG